LTQTNMSLWRFAGKTSSVPGSTIIFTSFSHSTR
jgi:hypothetical protein